MTCSNCYNGCAEIISDQCVKYTGNDIPVLGIKYGDSLASVEQSLSNYLITALNGTGIIPQLDSQYICEIVQNNLQAVGGTSLNDVLNALIKSICDIESSLSQVISEVSAINAPFNINCLEDVASNSGIHAIVQAVITTLCTLKEDVNSLATSLPTTYVLQENLEAEIANYFNSIGYGTRARDRMVPYTAVEYYGPLSNFDASGAGLNLIGSGGLDWTKVYLCNGNNSTPDKRGRVGVGCTNIPGPTLDPEVTPGGNNPSYTLLSKTGVNAVTLSSLQIPSHTHTAQSAVTENPHSHLMFTTSGTAPTEVKVTETNYAQVDWGWGDNFSYIIEGSSVAPTLGKTSSASSGITVQTTLENVGGGAAHTNIQPVLACNYIIYLP